MVLTIIIFDYRFVGAGLQSCGVKFETDTAQPIDTWWNVVEGCAGVNPRGVK